MTNELHLTNATVIHILLALSLFVVLLTTLVGELRTLQILAAGAALALMAGYARMPELMDQVILVLLLDGVLILPSLALAIGVGKLLRYGVRRIQRR